MKKTTIIILSVLLISTLTGCDNRVLHSEAQSEPNISAPESVIPNDLPEKMPESNSDNQFVRTEFTTDTINDTEASLSEPVSLSIELPKEWTVSHTVALDKDEVKAVEVLPCRKPAQDKDVFKAIMDEYSNYDLKGTKEFDISGNPVRLFIEEVQHLSKEKKPVPIYPHTYYVYIESKGLIFGISVYSYKLDDVNTLSLHKEIIESLEI